MKRRRAGAVRWSGFQHATAAGQLEAFEQLIGRNPVVIAILDRMGMLQLTDCWLAAGALFQTVWNVLSDRDLVRGQVRRQFGVTCPPYRSTRHAISTFPNCSSCLGVRPAGSGLEVFAPFGLTDLFAMRTRPNPVLAPAGVYQAKTSRWLKEWPQLTVLPWPAP